MVEIADFNCADPDYLGHCCGDYAIERGQVLIWITGNLAPSTSLYRLPRLDEAARRRTLRTSERGAKPRTLRAASANACRFPFGINLLAGFRWFLGHLGFSFYGLSLTLPTLPAPGGRSRVREGPRVDRSTGCTRTLLGASKSAVNTDSICNGVLALYRHFEFPRLLEQGVKDDAQ